MHVITNATQLPKKIDGRWKALADLRSLPSITGITVAKAATGPPVKKYWIKAAPEAAAKAAANGSAPVSNTTWRNGTKTETLDA